MRRLILLVIALISLGGVGLWATSTSQQIKREPLQKSKTPFVHLRYTRSEDTVSLEKK